MFHVCDSLSISQLLMTNMNTRFYVIAGQNVDRNVLCGGIVLLGTFSNGLVDK